MGVKLMIDQSKNMALHGLMQLERRLGNGNLRKSSGNSYNETMQVYFELNHMVEVPVELKHDNRHIWPVLGGSA